ncbi:MAG: S9 family peptidase [Acidobacteria bacterium]|nr:S9 family peptidase [Acidobacteriota bacterium]
MLPKRLPTPLLLILCALVALPARAQVQAGKAAGPATKPPTIDELIELKSVGSVRISPDGACVAYTVSSTDWKQDAYVTQIWLADVKSGRILQLTRGEKPAGNPAWSPDGAWLGFTSTRAGEKNQVFAIRPDGGEAVQLTNAENGVGGYEWSPDGKMIAFTSSDRDDKAVKARRDRLGDFEVVRREYAHQHLWTIDVAEAMLAPAAGTARTKGRDFSVGSFAWSPDSKTIAFSATVNPDLINGATADIYLLGLDGNQVRKLVGQPGPDTNPRWSPGGSSLVFSSAMGNPKHFHANSRLAVVPAAGGTPRSITDAFDERPGLMDWMPEGVYFAAYQRTAVHLFRVDPATGRVTRISQPDAPMLTGASFTKDGRTLGFAASSPTTLSEVYVSALEPFAPRRLTSMTEQAKGWTLGRREVISWRSKDGTEIEGVLIKPADFDPAKKRPLLCIIHGGPTGIDLPTMIDTRIYPSDIWAARGALVLKVNYRGSAGYGEKFRQLNVRNLGVGDAWDVLSGVEHLVKLGWVDPAKVGCMGWSQGGYISAFLTTSSTAFAAVSVGAGISNWATYYYNTDITPFTIQYLGADPAADPEIYAKTSPMTYIKQAKTPTLIQHGELDRRVPIPNAYELRQGLEDRGVKVEMIVYKGFGHGITKPKAMRAATRHNLAWFNHYIFGDPLPDLTAPEDAVDGK